MGRYAVPEGRIVKGWTVRLMPTPEQVARFKRDDGARRFACNWAVEEIRQAFSSGSEAGRYDSAVWSHYELRKRWNRVKPEVAPWWAECSKEAYSNGIADAVNALKNWHASKTGSRQGPRMGFPQFRKKGKDPVRCTYTTGALRVEDYRHVVLPGVGRVRSAENIHLILGHIRRGTCRVLSATVREKGGHWSVSLRLEITEPRQPGPRTDTVGVDAGIGRNLLVIMRPDGTVVRKVANPKALRSSITDLRRAARALSRKHEGSRRWQQAKRKLTRVHMRATAIRTDALHKATTELAKTHGRIVVEDLRPRAHARGVRMHRKAWADVAFGEFRRQLTYKCQWYGSELWIADRWFPSSKTCSSCGQVNAMLTLADRTWTCLGCGTGHDRDENAGTNLARLPASQAEAQSGGKTASVRLATVKRVKHPGRMAAKCREALSRDGLEPVHTLGPEAREAALLPPGGGTMGG
jgi:putative transposase